jgi:hypothetical protein
MFNTEPNMTKFTIQGYRPVKNDSEGPLGWTIPCDDAEATSFQILDENETCIYTCEHRAEAETWLSRRRRASRFCWGPDDLEHH